MNQFPNNTTSDVPENSQQHHPQQPEQFQQFQQQQQQYQQQQEDEVEEEEEEELISPDHPGEWTTAIESILLQCILDERFYQKHSQLDNDGKTRLWVDLHAKFILVPEVVQVFGEILADIRRTGSGGVPPESRYKHYIIMKDITARDPSFWPAYTIETSTVQNGVAGTTITTILQEDRETYTNTMSSTPAFLRNHLAELAASIINEDGASTYSPPHQTSTLTTSPSPTLASARATPTVISVPALTPAPARTLASASSTALASTLPTNSAVRTNSLSIQQAYLQNAERYTQCMETTMRTMTEQFSSINETYQRSVLQAAEHRRLDRLSREAESTRLEMMRDLVNLYSNLQPAALAPEPTTPSVNPDEGI
ncbi:hypothetical protein INT47_004804 [Mucor saturninus]|uniref:Uncharacterized protein n=1 Tax=Mucor saturninus TaxID=64648 RepID=A0A8H7R2N1_9FUNG|nr:hypothetical protein INT47_004804 [Mucor saturninus]